MTTQYDATGNDYTITTIKNVKKGEYVTRKLNLNNVYIRGDYDRVTKKYSLISTVDHCKEIFLKGDCLVYVGFTY